VRYEPPRTPGRPPTPPRLIASVPPVLFVDHKDRAWVGFVAVEGEKLIWLEARFTEGFFRDGLEVSATPLGPLDGLPRAGALFYNASEDDEALGRREAVLQLANGVLVRLKDGILQRMSAQGTPTSPILLAAGRNVTYLLLTDPARGSFLEAVH
jgi:predicted regulator of Ras-like GTPase activity (Roadblock/LC7/MglB family)